MSYLDLPIETNADKLAADILDRIMANVPNWVPREGHLETEMIEAIAQALSNVLAVGSRFPKRIFQIFGEKLIKLIPVGGASASIPTTWTMTDNAGHTIPAGTTVAVRTSAGVLLPFVTTAPVVVPNGSTATGAGAVTVVAVTPGTAQNGYPAGALTLVDSLAFVASVVSTAVSSGGADAESEDDYLDRLADDLTLMGPHAVVAADFALFARRVGGVFRATGLDNYDPGTDTFGQERMVTIAMIDEAGANVSAPVKTDVAALFAVTRETNFVVNIIDPTRTDIAVVYTGTALPGADPVAVKAAADAAVTALLDPLTWGSLPTNPHVWIQTGTVRFWDVVTAIESVEGFGDLTALTVNTGTVDVVLTGRITLPHLTSVTGTVT